MKKAKVLSILLAAIMIFTILPQCALAADAAQLDAALGSLADMGQSYVTVGALPTTVELDGETYTVTYTSTDVAAITSEGVVNHGYGVSNVTVTPQITVAGATVKGTAQKLIVLPDTSLANATFFEDFEGAEFDYTDADKFTPDATNAPDVFAKKLANATTYGKWTTGGINSMSEISIRTDATKYAKLRMSSPGTSSGQTQPYINATLDSKIMSSDMAVLTMKIANYLGGSGAAINVFPFFNVKRGAIYENIFHAGLSGSQTEAVMMGDGRTWNDLTAVRVKGATPEETVTEIFVNGKSVGTFNGETKAGNDANLFRVYIQRANENPTAVDDIYVVGMDLPQVKVGDTGNLVTSDTLPTSVSGYAVTYECSNPAVIAENGAVTRSLAPQFVTVTPKINIYGKIITLAAQSVTVMPKGTVAVSEDFEGDAFKPEAGANEKVFAAGSTVNGWTINTIDGYHTAKAVNDAARSRHFSMKVDDSSYSHQPSIVKTSPTPAKGINVIAFSAYVAIMNTSPQFSVNPYVTFSSTKPQVTMNVSSGETVDAAISQKVWHDYVIVRKNVGDVANAVTDVYMDGAKIATLVGDKGLYNTSTYANKIEFYLNRGSSNGNNYLLDNVVVMNYEFDVKVADKGNSYVTVDSLPSTIAMGNDSATVTYTTSDATVIATNGKVNHGKEIKKVTVTPQITVAGMTVAGTEQTVYVTPAGTEELFFDDFEGFTPGMLAEYVSGNALEAKEHLNGWHTYNFQTPATISIDNNETNGNFVNMDIVEISEGNGVNIGISKDYTPKGDMTIVGARIASGHNAAYYNPPETIKFGPFHMYKDGIKVCVNGTYNHITDTKLTPGRWYDLCYTIDYTDLIVEGKVTAYKTTLYINGEKITTTYTEAFDKFEVSMYRKKNADYYAMFDDVYIASVDTSDYVVASVDMTDSALTGYSIVSTKETPVASRAYAALYDGNGNLTGVQAADVNGDTTVSGISLPFGEATKLNIFVWSKAALQPLSRIYEKIFVAAE